MLILTRKLEQGIVIDGQIVIRLLAIEGERIKIGVDAPRAITVLREELLREVADQNQEAATARARGLRPCAHVAASDRITVYPPQLAHFVYTFLQER